MTSTSGSPRQSGGGTLHLELDGVDITGPITAPGTGGWQNWVTVTVPDVVLNGGVQTLRLAIDSGEFNVNKIEIGTPPMTGGPIVFDDMEHGNPFGNGWFAFGGSVGGGGIGPERGPICRPRTAASSRSRPAGARAAYRASSAASAAPIPWI